MNDKKIGVLEKPTCRYHDTDQSLSKSEEYRNAYPPLFDRMLACAPPANVARAIRKKKGAAWHDAAVTAMKNGNRVTALKFHWRSLVAAGGLRYLSYSRYFLMTRG